MLRVLPRRWPADFQSRKLTQSSSSLERASGILISDCARMDIDILFLSRDLSLPRVDVWNGIASQQGVTLRVHRVIGAPRLGDVNRLETIARARNQGKTVGAAPWVMFLDDDVVLGPRCAERLVSALRNRPSFAALGADCADQMSQGQWNWDYPPHVGMAATLFRRERLAGVTFRWQVGKCECQCCCDDLRQAGHAIGYLPGAQAWHRPQRPLIASGTGPSPRRAPELRSATNEIAPRIKRTTIPLTRLYLERPQAGQQTASGPMNVEHAGQRCAPMARRPPT
jgi:hypothetical protein